MRQHELPVEIGVPSCWNCRIKASANNSEYPVLDDISLSFYLWWCPSQPISLFEYNVVILLTGQHNIYTNCNYNLPTDNLTQCNKTFYDYYAKFYQNFLTYFIYYLYAILFIHPCGTLYIGLMVINNCTKIDDCCQFQSSV